MATREERMISRGTPFRLSWAAIFGGAVLAGGVWLLLQSLGLAIGFSGLEPTEGASLRALGIGTGIWSIVLSVISLFVGGMIAARSAGSATRTSGVIHGMVVWGLTTLVGAWLLALTLGSVIGTAATVGTSALGAAGAQMGQATTALGIDEQTLLGPVNERLRSEGKPPVRAEQVRQALQDATQQAVREGRLDREMLVSALMNRTTLSRNDAQQVVQGFERQMDQAVSGVEQGAEQAATVTAGMLWALFISMILSLVGAILGGLLGVTRRQRALAVATAEIPAVIAAPPREVYP